MRTSSIFVTVDAVIFRKSATITKVLLIKRLNPPFQNAWALPGGFVDQNEDLKTAVTRELREETGLEKIELRQLHTFGTIGRDPRGHMISVAYYGFADENAVAIASDDAAKTEWFDLTQLPSLAFDHIHIITMAQNML